MREVSAGKSCADGGIGECQFRIAEPLFYKRSGFMDAGAFEVGFQFTYSPGALTDLLGEYFEKAHDMAQSVTWHPRGMSVGPQQALGRDVQPVEATTQSGEGLLGWTFVEDLTTGDGGHVFSLN